MQSNLQEDLLYNVVINEEEQYSIWPTFKTIPAGWKEVGMNGKKEECLAYIKEVWVDMRPLSLRKQMAQWQSLHEKERERLLEKKPSSSSQMSTLVIFLANGTHPISLSPTYKTVESFKISLKQKYVHLHFTNTLGGTCLGVSIDIETHHDQIIHLEGNLILDYVRVRCFADIDLSTLCGFGKINILESVNPLSTF